VRGRPHLFVGALRAAVQRDDELPDGLHLLHHALRRSRLRPNGLRRLWRDLHGKRLLQPFRLQVGQPE
jgi:hypothetical protein